MLFRSSLERKIRSPHLAMMVSATCPVPASLPKRCSWAIRTAEINAAISAGLSSHIAGEKQSPRRKAQHKKAIHSFRVDVTRALATHVILVNGQGEERSHRVPYQCPTGEATSPSTLPHLLFQGSPSKHWTSSFIDFFPTSSR